jgi:tetratricopeptide (TPR) repeat protein
MVKEFPSGNFENWISSVPGAASACRANFEHKPAQEKLLGDWAQVLSSAALYICMKGQYKKAEGTADSAIKTRERVGGRDNPVTLASIGILGLVLQYQGKYEAVEEMNRRVLEGRQKALGEEHPETLASVSNLVG